MPHGGAAGRRDDLTHEMLQRLSATIEVPAEFSKIRVGRILFISTKAG
ncbi:MAG: hypothetical protein AB7S61_01540 [Methanoregulaceae archaeon]